MQLSEIKKLLDSGSGSLVLRRKDWEDDRTFTLIGFLKTGQAYGWVGFSSNPRREGEWVRYKTGFWEILGKRGKFDE